jgi:hypothetical protein
MELLPERLAVCRLDPEDGIGDWDPSDGFLSLTFTDAEISVVCEEAAVPADAECERGWRCLRVDGPLGFDLVGVLASLTGPLAEAGISVFAVSTYETDYLLVRSAHLDRAVAVLSEAGHVVRT